MCQAIGLAAQGKYNQNWYFGKNGGLDFSTNPPTMKTDSKMDAYSGSNCYSDPLTGALLFYIDGDEGQLYNGNHELIGTVPNNDIVILPIKQRPGVYAVINRGFAWVDVNAGAGKGAVVNKGKTPFGNTINRVTAIKHCFNDDYWILSVENQPSGKDVFVAFRMKPDGTFTDRTISPIPLDDIDQFAGDLVSNHQGDKLAITNYSKINSVFLMDFDKKCGKVSNVQTLPKNAKWDFPFGISFSPDDNFLYVAYSYTESQIVQFETRDISKWVEVANSSQNFNQIMNGPDGRLYITTHIDGIPSGKLDVIEKPNVKGMNCAYKGNFINLSGPTNFHVPNFVISHTGGGCNTAEPKLVKTIPKGGCETSYLLFKVDFTVGTYTDVEWQFGDGEISTLPMAQHKYSGTGKYQGLLRLKYCDQFDSFPFEVDIVPSFTVDLGEDTTVCYHDAMVLKSNTTAGNCKWNTGDTTKAITIDKPGIYVLTVNSNGCEVSDTFRFRKYGELWTDLGNEYFICEKDNDLVKLDAGHGFESYYWKPTQDTTQWIIVKKSGDYFVVVEDFRGCSTEDGTRVKKRCDMNFYIPSSFTPNGDGLNEIFGVTGHDIEGIDLILYNRWGEQIFTIQNLLEVWDGCYKEKPAPIGVYFYTIRVTGYRNKLPLTIQEKGILHLIR